MKFSILIFSNVNSKEQIGMPTDFKHITHVGFDPDKGFSQFNMDEKLQGFFNMVCEYFFFFFFVVVLDFSYNLEIFGYLEYLSDENTIHV